MMDKWIQVGETDYFLKGDRLNWIVARRVKCSVSERLPDGFNFVDFTYHGKLSGAFQRIFDETVRLAEYRSIEDLLRIIEESHAMLKDILDREFAETSGAVRERVKAV